MERGTDHAAFREIETRARVTAAEFAARLPAPKPYGRGYRAPCPSHGSRSSTLSIAPSRHDGTVVHCFAGCPTEDVTRSVGLTMRDLAPAIGTSWSAARVRRQPTQEEIRAALVDEEKLYLNERGISDGERLVAADIAPIRHTVAVRLGVSFAAVRRAAADSHTGGHERDTLWPELLSRAWREVWIAYDGRDACCAVDDFAAHGEIGLDMLAAAENAAAAQIRALAKRRAARAWRAA